MTIQHIETLIMLPARPGWRPATNFNAVTAPS